MGSLLVFVVSVVSLTLSQTHSEGVFLDRCNVTSIDDKFKVAYRNWPYRIACKLSMKPSDYDVYYLAEDYVEYRSISVDETELPISCLVLNRYNQVVFNRTTNINDLTNDNNQIGYFIPKLTYQSSLVYSLVIQSQSGSNCLRIPFTIKLIDLEPITCLDFISDLDFTSDNNVPVGVEQDYECIVNSEEFPKVFAGPNVTYQWFHNCTSGLPTNAQPYTSEYSEERLRIHPINFTNGGIYVCTATNDGEVRFVYKNQICIRHGPSSFSEHTIRCKTTRIRSNVGREVRQTCTITYGRGVQNSLNVRLSLFKDGEAVAPRCFNKRLNTADRISCFFEIFNEDQCYFYEPPEEEQNNFLGSIVVYITIRNIESDDFGFYSLRVRPVIEGFPIVYGNFTVEQDTVTQIMSLGAFIGICIGIVVAVALLIGFVVYNKVYFQIVYTNFFGKPVADNKPYGVYLTYNFSHYSTDKFTKDLVRDWIPRIRDSFEELGYRVYDEHKDGSFLLNRGDNVKTAVERSHRLAILLSLDFIKDDWSIFAIQKGFNNMVTSGSKVIFFLFPGIKEHIKQHESEYQLLQTALKLNHVIKLPKRPETSRRILYQIRNAMPLLC